MKNIILLSDGTGNGAAKRHRTNVWRLYRALDLHRNDQIAYYDDGVGSQEFLPLKILGGAIGFGLKRNVIELYKFLCRTYKPGDGDDPADRIYLFGFSRGAFTVRVLAGMIVYCGLCTEFDDEADLAKKATRNYNAFRSRFKHGLLWRAYRFLTGASSEVKHSTVKPGIEFIGVWDTVDAYGLPIDELAILWDWLVFPIRFPDKRLSKKVNRACHAVSIDDERHTFHPVLWDESEEQTERIEQVWFAGVHSDVGGGYPMNDLSLVPLDWMMSRVEAVEPEKAEPQEAEPEEAEPEEPATEEAEPGGTASPKPGLHFIHPMRKEIESHSDWHGVQHDSRSGFASYYRYKPRNLAHLCKDLISTAKIHRGVMERIKVNAVPYAPTGLPKTYKVVATRGEAQPYESEDQRAAKANALNYALDVVHWRRWLYAALLVTTLALLASRFFLDWKAGGICDGSACAIDPLLLLVIATLPDFAAGWFEALRQNSAWLWGFIATFFVLFTLKSMAWKKTLLEATKAWAQLKRNESPPAWTPTLTSKLRGLLRGKLGTVIKWAAATLVFALILALLVVFAGRTSFYARNTLGLLCKTTAADLEDSTMPRIVTLDISKPCFATGITLKEGDTYRFEVDPPDSNQPDVDRLDKIWSDGETDNVGPDGFTSAELPFLALAPLRRTFSERWLKLMGQVGDAGKEQLVIGSGLKSYRARSDGELFLYVNDAVFGFLPGRYWAWPYFWEKGRNKGTVKVTVTQVENYR